MNQTVSKEMAVKLKEAGWEQGPRFCYGKYSGDTELWRLFDWWSQAIPDNNPDNIFAAPTTTELLGALSEKALFGELNWNYHGGTWGARFTFELGKHVYLMPDERQKNPADALALIWMFVKKLGMI